MRFLLKNTQNTEGSPQTLFRRRQLRHAVQLSKIHRRHFRNALFGHMHTIYYIYRRHRRLVVRDDDKLRMLGKFLDDFVEFFNVRVVKWRVNFVENTERRGFVEVQSEQKRGCRQGFFTAR